ncbi:unnamed protein product [Linum tenue]|uniref:Uncharacterized protein n=1 Tax=Linum tenue TaxID=586396 RepID=A0AAV0NDW1_9ROSI|nr:unnamed protein product [Linum tenue]
MKMLLAPVHSLFLPLSMNHLLTMPLFFHLAFVSFHWMVIQFFDRDVEHTSISSLSRVFWFLDKELAASGFTRKDQNDMAKFIEGGADSVEDENEEHVSEEDEEEDDLNATESLLQTVGGRVEAPREIYTKTRRALVAGYARVVQGSIVLEQAI